MRPHLLAWIPAVCYFSILLKSTDDQKHAEISSGHGSLQHQVQQAHVQ